MSGKSSYYWAPSYYIILAVLVLNRILLWNPGWSGTDSRSLWELQMRATMPGPTKLIRLEDGSSWQSAGTTNTGTWVDAQYPSCFVLFQRQLLPLIPAWGRPRQDNPWCHKATQLSLIRAVREPMAPEVEQVFLLEEGDRASLCSPGWSRPLSLSISHNHWDPPASASQVLRLKAWTRISMFSGKENSRYYSLCSPHGCRTFWSL